MSRARRRTTIEPVKHREWDLIIYRVPTDSSRARVAVWRDLKRMGGLYLQQCVCLFPARSELTPGLTKVRNRIDELGGSSTLLRVPHVDDAQQARFVDGFRDLAARDYAEIVEECDTKFVKEIEFERFRENYTYEEAEEIRHDLEKIRRWYKRVVARDWFDAPGRADVEDRISSCEQLLEAFEEDVYARVEEGEPSTNR